MLKGIGAAPGIRFGPVFQFQRQEISINEVSDGLVIGWERLPDALVRAREQLNNLNHQMVEKGLKPKPPSSDAYLGCWKILIDRGGSNPHTKGAGCIESMEGNEP